MINNSSAIQINKVTENYDRLIRKYSYASNGYYLLRIDSTIAWNEFSEFIYKNLNDLKILHRVFL